ncbi:MAG: glycine cleavage system protein GcvH [Firmicutes bacterium]|nr:glycine cleavage system protein GcvH [Bacillota bacterium]
MMVPEDRWYTREHEWVKLEDKKATIGITDYAQEELGDIVFVDLPSVGERVEAGGRLASVESVKAVSDVYAPVAGEILAVNDDLEHSPEYLNQDPYGKGWIAVVEMEEEPEGLLSARAYEELLAKLKEE